MIKRLGTKLSSKSSGTQSTSSSFTDSILFSSRTSHAPPPIPEFHRQEIPPHTLMELRLACAAIVKETGPSGAELEAILNQADPLEQYKKEEQHRKDIEKIRLQAARTHTSGFPPVRGARERDRLSKSNFDSFNASSASLVSPQLAPKQLSHKPLIPSASAKTAVDAKDLDSQNSRRPVSRKPVPYKQDERVLKAKPQHEARAKSSDGPTIHQNGQTEASSTSSTRSNTTAENRASTNQTSFANTPAIDTQRSSLPYPLRSSSQNQILRPNRQDQHGSMSSDIDFFAPNPDYEVPSLYHAKGGQSVPSRARSRAGSIKDSIIGGIRDYMQPRSSIDRSSRPQSRQSRSTTRDHSKTPSRASSMTRSSKEWMRNAASSLRRKGSISSMISSRGGDDGSDDRGRKKDKNVDLNRQLPPLPGLDSYKEPKKHIAQLLARSKFSSKSVVEPVSPLENASTSQIATQSDLSIQTVTALGKASPDSSSSRHPRIPFAEASGEDVSDSLRPRSSPKQRKRSNDPLDRQQEDELRRVVREKIQQGGLSKEAFEAQDKNDGLKRTKTVKQNSWELEQMEAGYISTSQKSPSHQRNGSVAGATKKGFRGRFSKLLGHGPAQSSVIASH